MTELKGLPLRESGRLRTRLLPLPLRHFPVSILHEELPVFSKTPAIYHKTTHEYVIVLRGKGTALLDGRRFQLRKDAIFHIPAGSIHQFRTGRSKMEALSIFSPALCAMAPDVHMADGRRSKKR